MAREYKILQIALGAEDVEMTLNHTIRDDWEFLSCVALSPTVLCYTFQREKLPARGGRKRIEDASPVSSPEFDRMSVEEQQTKKVPKPEQEVVSSEQSNVRISPRTGKPMRVYKKRIK